MSRIVELGATLALILISGWLSIAAYQDIVRSKSDSSILIDQLDAGIANYILKQDEACVGGLNLHVNEDSLRELNLRGGMRIKPLGATPSALDSSAAEALDIQFDLQTFYNPIGQLFRGEGRIEAGDFAIEFSLTDVQPILLQVSVFDPKLVYDQNFKLNGPITLTMSPDGTEYLFDVSSLEAFNQLSNVGPNVSKILSNRIGLTVTPGSSDELTDCLENSNGAVSLDQAGQELFGFSPAILKLMEQMRK